VRIFLGFLIAGVALAGAVWLHQWKSETVELTGWTGYAPQGSLTHSFGDRQRAGWQDPLAVVIAFAGVGAGVALAVSGSRSPATT
jgi:hypothetical protein